MSQAFGSLNILNAAGGDLETIQFAITPPGRPPKRICGHRGDLMLQLLKWPDPWKHAFDADFYRKASRGGACVEVGANIGSTTVFLADFFTRVHAFEPSSRNREVLKRNLDINGVRNTTIIPAALADRVGTAVLHLDAANNSGQDSLLPQEEAGRAATEQVPVTTLDAALPGVTDVTLVHIDAEGYDVKVLEGARAFLRRQQQRPCVLVEFAPRQMLRAGSTADDLLAIVGEFGYRIVLAANHNPSPVTPGLLREMFEAWKDAPGWEDLYLLP